MAVYTSNCPAPISSGMILNKKTHTTVVGAPPLIRAERNCRASIYRNPLIAPLIAYGDTVSLSLPNLSPGTVIGVDYATAAATVLWVNGDVGLHPLAELKKLH